MQRGLTLSQDGQNLHRFIFGKRKKSAFTLAEVLITLGIIGIVAALTLPSLIAKHEKKVIATRLKKSYSVMAQAFLRAEAKYGPAEHWAVEKSKYYITEFLDVKTCRDANVYAKASMYLTDLKNNGQFKDLGFISNSDMRRFPNSGGTSGVNTDNHCWIFKDGTIIHNWVDNPASGDGDAPWGEFAIDVNGFRKPNIAYKDNFVFCFLYDKPTITTNWIGNMINIRQSPSMRKGLYPGAYGTAGRPCIGKRDGGCTRRIMGEGWQIKDDYPWDAKAHY